MQQGQGTEAPPLYYNVNTPPPDEVAPPVPLPEGATNEEATKLTQSTKRNYYRKKKEGIKILLFYKDHHLLHTE